MVEDEHACAARALITSYQQATPLIEAGQETLDDPQGFLEC
jgi:hypothetical protein